MLRGAIIGFGAVAANGHSPAYAKSSSARVVAVVDRSEDRRNAAAAFLGDVETFATIEELAAGAQIDFVDICTPPALHSEAILDALAHGWNVLCEKPLVLDLVELEKIRSLACAVRRAVVPVHNWKYAPIICRATEALRRGAIGGLREVQIETLRSEDCAAVDPNNRNWRRDPGMAGGGVLIDHGWHAIYLVGHWFQEDPVNVEAVLHRATSSVEDEATVTLQFRQGHARIFLTWRADHRRNTMRLTGETGVIAIDDDTLRIGGEEVRFGSALSAGSHHPDWFAAMLPDVLATFREPEKSWAGFEEAATCLSTIRRAYQIGRIGLGV